MNISSIIEIASSQRKGFAEAISHYKNGDGPTQSLPKSLVEIYRFASGTKSSVEDQRLMDLVPGFRLIHKEELHSETQAFLNLYKKKEGEYFPFLADYSSCYRAVRQSDGAVCAFAQDSEEEILSQSLESFIQTIYSFYNEGVYFLDDQNYLDYDFEKEGLVGKRINPGCGYWE